MLKDWGFLIFMWISSLIVQLLKLCAIMLAALVFAGIGVFDFGRVRFKQVVSDARILCTFHFFIFFLCPIHLSFY